MRVQALDSFEINSQLYAHWLAADVPLASWLVLACTSTHPYAVDHVVLAITQRLQHHKWHSWLDLWHFLRFLSQRSVAYPTVWHWVLSFFTKLPSNQQVQVGGNWQIYQKQLLWSATLELLNTTIDHWPAFLVPSSSGLVQTSPSSSSSSDCSKCHHFVTTPYKLSCCKAICCYVCSVTLCQRHQRCPQCNSVDYVAHPIYL